MLPNTTGTDIFCSGQSVLSSGEVLITGGDLTINGQRNFSNQQTTVFHPQTNTITAAETMVFPRWYPSVVSLPGGDKLVVGGRQDQFPDVAVPTPEVYGQGTGWRTLWDATSDAAFGTGAHNWYYPRAFVTPDGRVFVLGNDGNTFYLNSAGNGTITQLAQNTPSGDYPLPTLMFTPGKVLSIRNQQKVIVVDVNGAEPVITTSQNIDQVRYWSNATVLADGKVLVTGGVCGGQPTDRRGVRRHDLGIRRPACGPPVPTLLSRVCIIRSLCCCRTAASSPPAAARRGR